VSGRRSWPRRFVVSIHTRAGGTVRYRVVTWLSAEKAVAWAVFTHARRDARDEAVVADVEVLDAGPAASNPDGTVLIDDGELVDRFEF
jgi:hypothetical protein